MLNALTHLTHLIDRLTQAAPPLYKVKVTCKENTHMFSFEHFDTAMERTVAWVESGHTKKVELFNPEGELIYVTRCNIKKPMQVEE